MQRALNRLSWMLLGVAAISVGCTAALVAAAGVLLHRLLPFIPVLAIVGMAVCYKLITAGDGSSAPPPSSAPQSPPRQEPEISLAELRALRQLWLAGDIPESTYKFALAQRTRRYRPPAPPAPPRRRRWP